MSTSSKLELVNTSFQKVTIVPLEGDAKHASISTKFNPKELSFTKSAGWSDDNVGCETDYPALAFTAGQAISLNIEFMLDKYEDENKDVRPWVKSLVHLCEIQKIDGETAKRPPRVQLVWSDADPIGVGNFCGVVESAQATYTMFTNDGIPCRAKVSVTMKQADSINTKVTVMNADGSLSEIYTINDPKSYTYGQATSINGFKEAVEKGGGKFEDKSTWPDPLEIVTNVDDKSEEE